MIIIEDTRNQVGKHEALNRYFESQGVKVVRSKLFVGDYARLDNQTICIDTKKDVVEICNNICGKQHERFKNECIRARDNGIQLIILVEEDTPRGLQEWCSPRKRDGRPITQVKGETLYKAIMTMEERYGVKFIFRDKSVSGETILDIFRRLEK